MSDCSLKFVNYNFLFTSVKINYCKRRQFSQGHSLGLLCRDPCPETLGFDPGKAYRTIKPEINVTIKHNLKRPLGYGNFGHYKSISKLTPTMENPHLTKQTQNRDHTQRTDVNEVNYLLTYNAYRLMSRKSCFTLFMVFTGQKSSLWILI